ncbi:MAG TPA: HNH endonuclease signature motif containing protein [Kiloniellales bacterium]
MTRLTAPPARLRSAPERLTAPERASGGERYGWRWDLAAKAYRRANPLCLGCAAVGDTRATQVADHIVPFKGDERLKWDPANRQPACDWHHSVVKQRLEARFERGEIGAEDLRLDSAAAVALTLELGRAPRQ